MRFVFGPAIFLGLDIYPGCFGRFIFVVVWVVVFLYMVFKLPDHMGE